MANERTPLQAFESRLKRREATAFQQLEREIGQLHQKNVVAGQLKSGSTVRSSAAIADAIQRQLATDLLNDVEAQRHARGHKARLEAVRVSLVRFSLTALDYFRLDIVNDQPSVMRSARGLLAASAERATAMVEDYKAGFPIEGVKAEPDPGRGSWWSGLERWAKRNDALQKILYFVAGAAVSLAVKSLF